MKIKAFYFFLLLFVFPVSTSFAVDIPAQNQATRAQASTSLQEKDLKLRETIKKERAPAGVDQVRQQEIQQMPDSEKVQVVKIEVSDAKFLTAKEIRKIIAPFEKQTLTIREMQDVANRVTDAYRQKGYITSRAVLPPQKVENGILKISVVEGKMGKISVQGNKYFSTALIKRRIDLKAGQPFNYDKIKRNLSTINQYQDRKVKTVLAPGQEAGTTDLVLDVKDNLPLHMGLSFDNYGSRYLRKNRYQGSLTHNNLLGFDDIMTLTYQQAEGRGTYRLQSLRYLFPINNETQIGFYAGETELKLGREYGDLAAYGKSKIYSLYLTRSLFANDTTDVSFNVGYDWKDVQNYQLNSETSRDRLRVPRGSLKIDRSDNNGRTIINNELNVGIPGKNGALNEVDPLASRTGAGGKFTKNVLDILRLHKMPLESTLLLKGQVQFASRVFTATEQFQIGGIYNVRGYPSGESVGDDGQALTAELSFPVYFIPKSIRAPFSQAKVYDALKVATFYDVARSSLRNPGAGEPKDKSLSSVGCGLRYDLPESFTVKWDVAWSLDEIPSDGHHMHSWIKVTKEF